MRQALAFWADHSVRLAGVFPERRRSGSAAASFAVISRAPLSKIGTFKRRMGWWFTWVSSFGTDFNYDYRASFTPDEMARGKVDYNFDLVEFPSTRLLWS